MLIDKPTGWTSHDVVARVRRTLGIRSVGHAGTLDPFATGLLVVLVGRATRLARFVESATKAYDATITLGESTDTEDSTGRVLTSASPDHWPGIDRVEQVLQEFRGGYRQQPPAFSAKHVGGTRSYLLARAGAAVELQPVDVRIDALNVISWEPPRLRIHAHVGAGTYMRALARDIGARLDLPAHCSELRRTAVGPFHVDDATGPEQVSAGSLRSPAAMVAHLPAESVGTDALDEISFGRTIPQLERHGGYGALLSEAGELAAIATGTEGRWQPVVVLRGRS